MTRIRAAFLCTAIATASACAGITPAPRYAGCTEQSESTEDLLGRQGVAAQDNHPRGVSAMWYNLLGRNTMLMANPVNARLWDEWMADMKDLPAQAADNAALAQEVAGRVAGRVVLDLAARQGSLTGISTPIETATRRRGSSADIAVLAYFTLTSLGVPEDDILVLFSFENGKAKSAGLTVGKGRDAVFILGAQDTFMQRMDLEFHGVNETGVQVFFPYTYIHDIKASATCAPPKKALAP